MAEISQAATPMNTTYGSIIASYDNIEDVVDPPDEGNIPIFIFIGPKLKIKRILKLYYFVFIFMIFRIYYQNGGILMTTIMKTSFFPNGSDESKNSGDPFVFDHPYINYLFESFQFAIPGMLSIVFAFTADYYRFQRANLINYSLGISCFSAFVIAICGYILQPDGYVNPDIEEKFILHKVLGILGLISFCIGLAIYLPASLAYGLDILKGTNWKVIYLYFPLMYFSNNVSSLCSYLRYLDTPDNYLLYNCCVNFVFVLLAWILFIIGRSCKFMSDSEQTIAVGITTGKSIKIICYALRERIFNFKSPEGHWFIQLASEKYYGKFPHQQVQIVSSFLRINFLLLILFVTFIASQMLETGFPNQGYMLSTLYFTDISLQNVYCNKSQEEVYINNISFINYISVIIATPLIEYFFWNVSFYVDINRERNVTGIRKCIKTIENIVRDYFHPIDPILKKMFWGLLCGFSCILCALFLEVARISTIRNNSQHINCSMYNFNHTYKISTISVFSQVPQYCFGGILEVLIFIGIQQFLYFQSYTTFKGCFNSFFLSLYYFYLCFGMIISNTVYTGLDLICTNSKCSLCLIYSDSCSQEDFEYASIVWGVFIVLYVIIIVIFGIFSHYRYYNYKKHNIVGVDYYDHIADPNLIEG
ncbi:hypothetical protein LOD99_13029 [Oopsacas minuta]|uniref:Uncharacterized protein n=1 Tax=Oopsacas minuta TaxID=111878 RepID=A0AAV7JAM8_9METZ|nr:hypothetical protein LOD99_13029 [Oopsacas minuta]